jgi:hypothetical protein
MDHRKAESVVFWNSIQDFRSFSQSEVERWRSVPPLFCLETEFSSNVDRRTSVTSKPFINGQSRMSNGQKSVRVAQVFGVQLRNKFPREQIRFRFLLTAVRFFTDFYIFLVSYWYGVCDILLCPHFRWSWMITTTSTSQRMADCVPRASTARGF